MCVGEYTLNWVSKTKRIVDLTGEVEIAKDRVNDPNDDWQDYIDWKELRSKRCKHVMVHGKVYSYNKWGIIDYEP